MNLRLMFLRHKNFYNHQHHRHQSHPSHHCRRHQRQLNIPYQKDIRRASQHFFDQIRLLNLRLLKQLLA
jgi:hypothetical protein